MEGWISIVCVTSSTEHETQTFATMTTKAIINLKPGKGVSVQMVPIPKLRAGWVLVDVKAVALNPTDWKKVDFGEADLGAQVGCDYAGVVREIGSNVTSLKKGDRVASLVHGGLVMFSFL